MMKKKQFLFICLMLFSVFAMAEREIGNVRGRWNHNVEDDRAMTTPILFMDESTVYIYSTKQLDGVDITVTDYEGHVVYSETRDIPAEIDSPVSIDLLPQGKYYFLIMQGDNYLVGEFTK